MNFPHPDIAAPKAAVRALIDACGGAEAVASLLGLRNGRSLVDGWANPNAPERRISLQAVWRMESFCGRAVVSEAGVRRIEDSPSRERRVLTPADIGPLGKELSDVIAAKAAAWSDGHLDAADRRALAKEYREAIKELQSQLDAAEGA